MAPARPLFVAGESLSDATTPLDARLALAGLIAPAAAFGARAGVLSGCEVSGTPGWAYSVSPGHVVTSLSAGDGVALWANAEHALAPTDPAPMSGSRIDIAYAQHRDPEQGAATSAPLFGVAKSDPAASPIPPVLPAGAVELRRFTVASGTTSTQGAATSSEGRQMTALAGSPIPATSLAQRNALNALASPARPVLIEDLTTGTLRRSVGSGWADVLTGGTWQPYTPALSTGNLGTGGTAVGRYCVVGKTVRGWAAITLGTGGGGGSGVYSITLPLQSATDGATKIVGAAGLVDASASTLRHVGAVILQSSATNVQVFPHGANSTMTNTVPWTWAESDIIRIEFCYELP